MPLEYFHRYVGVGDVGTVPQINQDVGLSLDVMEAVGEKLRHYLLLIEERGLEPLPGIAASWQMLRQRGIRVAVATSSLRHVAKVVLKAVLRAQSESLPANEFFDAIMTRDDVEHEKPAPDIYLKTAAALGVPPEQCLAVEDSVPGVKSACAAGMYCVAVPTRFTDPKLLDQATHVASSMAEVVRADFYGLLDGMRV
jgi:HAD superfamily hydrolase (TIGR01509 family)